jgi:hypothetical protein
MMELLSAIVKPAVLMNGRPLDIGLASAHVPAILETRHQGICDGNAVASLLFGKANLGGKTSFHLAASTIAAAQGRRYWNKESKRCLLTDGK